MPLVEVEELRLGLGGRTILDGVTFDVAAGEVVGLLGPNGAGKTTTLSVLATLRRPDAGRARVGGHEVTTDPAAVRRALGIVPQSLALYPSFTARENLALFARLLGLGAAARAAAIGGALDLVGLADRADDLVATFSGGMQRRLNLACGILHTPPVLLLDEPTVGVDPQSRERILDAVRGQAANGAAVLYSTHYLDEAERICDRVVLVDHGRVVATGTAAELVRASLAGLQLRVVTRAVLPAGWLDGVADGRLRRVAEASDVVVATRIARGHETHVVLASADAASLVLERAAAAGDGVVEFHLNQPSLQDVFLQLTGKDLRD
jgi:ABC-2 type transport system ATP-binding protein